MLGCTLPVLNDGSLIPGREIRIMHLYHQPKMNKPSPLNWRKLSFYRLDLGRHMHRPSFYVYSNSFPPHGRKSDSTTRSHFEKHFVITYGTSAKLVYFQSFATFCSEVMARNQSTG